MTKTSVKKNMDMEYLNGKIKKFNRQFGYNKIKEWKSACTITQEGFKKCVTQKRHGRHLVDKSNLNRKYIK